MASTDPILTTVLAHFLQSAENEQFNGLRAEALLKLEPNQDELRSILSELIAGRKVDCVLQNTK